MKALSIHPYYAMAIVAGQKNIEVRTWKTEYRGDILICSTNRKLHGTIAGHALGIVTLKDIRPLKREDCPAALITAQQYKELENAYAWVLDYNRLIKPVPVKGKLSLWDYTGSVEIIPDKEWILPPGVKPEDAPAGDWVKKYWEPLMT